MSDDISNYKYGLSPKEARMIGLGGEGDDVVNKDVELDSIITRRIRSMGASHVKVGVKAGKVTLSGMCDDFSEKRSLAMVARSIPGVVKVINQVKVIPSDTGRPGRG